MARLSPPIPPTIRPSTSPSPANTKAVTKTVRSSSTKARTRVTEAEYWEKYYVYVGPADHQYEWNNGYLEEKSMTDYVSCLMYDWFKILLREYLQTQPVAKMVSLEMGFRLALPHKIVIRKPDLGLVLNSNPVPLGPFDPSYRGTLDVCLESLSYSTPGEVKRDTVHKKHEYAQGGVKEYYLLDARGQGTTFYQLTAGGIYTPIPPTPEGLIRSNVLPGFQFRFTDLQRQPSLAEMSEDGVYQGFVGLDRQAERQARQQAESQAQTEKEARRKETGARQMAESQAQVERDARQMAESQAQVERDARQMAESQAQVEREARHQETAARQLAESKVQQLEAELARLRQPNLYHTIS